MTGNRVEFKAYPEVLQEKIKSLENKKINFIHDEENNILVYNSFGDPSSNFNMKYKDSDGKPIACRHLASFFLTQDSSRKSNENSYHHTFKAPQRIPFLAENHYDKNRLQFKDRAYHFITLENLGDKLAELARPLALNSLLRLAFNSENHMMAFKIQRKPNGFWIKFYDPNQTLIHQQLWCPDVKTIAKLSIDDFLLSTERNFYFPKFSGYLSEVVLAQSANNVTPILSVDKRLSEEDKLYFGLTLGFSNIVDTSLKGLLGINVDGGPILEVDKLTSEENAKRLAAKTAMGVPGLFMALQNGHAEAVKVYLEAVLGADQFISAVKAKLLDAKDHCGVPGLKIASQKEHSEAVKVYIETVLGAEQLDSKDKADLLFAKCINGVPALFMALQNGHSEVVKVYVEAILGADQLNPTDKADLLFAERVNGVPGLFMALQSGHSETVKIYVEAVLGTDQLVPTVKAKLVNAKDYRGIPGLFMALQKGHSETVKIYIEAVLGADKLTLKDKIELVVSKRLDGVPGLNRAIKMGYSEVVNAYVGAILGTDKDKLSETELFTIFEMIGRNLVAQIVSFLPKDNADVLVKWLSLSKPLITGQEAGSLFFFHPSEPGAKMPVNALNQGMCNLL